MAIRELLPGGHARGRRVLPAVLGGVYLWGGLALLPGHESVVRAQSAGRVETGGSPEAVPLTAAQEEARQLAIALINESEAPAAVAAAVPLSILVERPLAPGQRPVLPLFTIQGVEGRLVGGPLTLASPVAQTSTSAATDANRPLFVPADEAQVGVELLFE